AHGVRPRLQRDRNDLRLEAHLEVQTRRYPPFQVADVVVLDVAAIRAQVRRDAARAGFFGPQRPGDGVGERFTARLAQRGDVIDVDVELGHRMQAEDSSDPTLSARGSRTAFQYPRRLCASSPV